MHRPELHTLEEEATVSGPVVYGQHSLQVVSIFSKRGGKSWSCKLGEILPKEPCNNSVQAQSEEIKYQPESGLSLLQLFFYRYL